MRFMSLYVYANHMPTICQLSQVFSKGYRRRKIINTAGKITSGDIQKMFKISRQAAHKEIKALMELGVIKSQGEGRATYYVLD